MNNPKLIRAAIGALPPAGLIVPALRIHQIAAVIGQPVRPEEPVLADAGGRQQRVAGADRYATAAEVAKASWGSGAERVFLASGEQFPDALSGTPAAAASDAPLLLTRSTCRPQATSATLSAFKPALTVILGGTAAVSDDPRTC